MSLLVEQPASLGAPRSPATGIRHHPARKYHQTDIPTIGYLFVPMSREEFLELDYEFGKAEWADGVAILMAAARNPHSLLVGNVISAVISSLTGIRVIPEVTLPLDDSVREPDLAIVPTPNYSPNWRIGIPLVVIEVLSPSTRKLDMGQKADEYLAHGISQYWVVDPVAESIEVRMNVGSEWRSAVVVDAENPEAEIAVGEHGVVWLDHAAIFE